ncbi:flagellar associated protein [Baffinella frigidus]|nr:flagellar associated protein [Cryptophyta sp. CCMP2293]
MATKSQQAYGLIHTARFGNHAANIEPLEFVRPLSEICLRSAAMHFRNRPTFAGVPERYKEHLAALIPTDIPLSVSGPLIDNEVYWKRCASDLFQNCLPADHGHSWKQLFFEKTVEEALENFDGSDQAHTALVKLLRTSQDYVYKLKIRQFAAHADVALLFDNLPNLYAFSITYGSRNVGMKYERSIFGMKLADAEFLSQQLPRSETLTTLVLNENILDDEKVRRLVVGLRDNMTITSLDLSHNKISDRGSRALCKCLGKDSVISTLSLCDNHIHSEGGKFLGRALQSNLALVDLNIRLNRLGEKGGCYIFEGLKSNGALSRINVSGNGLGDGSGQGEAVRVMAAMLRVNRVLTHVDISSNSLGEEGGVVLRDALEENDQVHPPIQIFLANVCRMPWKRRVLHHPLGTPHEAIHANRFIS